MIQIDTPEIVRDLLAHAKAQAPRECCGMVLNVRGKLKYHACRNDSGDPDKFIIHVEDYIAGCDRGRLVAIAHSHTFTAPTPSVADRVQCEQTKTPWIIINPTTEEYTVTVPSGFKLGLYEREFVHGIIDCYTFAKDYYAELGIVLPDFEREDDWWYKGKNLYVDNFQAAGFVQVPAEALRDHDALLLRVYDSSVPNHSAIYLGHGLIGHHMYKRLSCRDVYIQFYRDRTTHTLRHKDLM